MRRRRHYSSMGTSGGRRRRPLRRRSRNSYGMRHRNPSFGLVTKGLTLAGGGALTQFVTAMVPAIGGPGPLMDAARTGAVAYLLGMVANRVGMSRFSGDITLGGFAVAGAKIINGILLPTASSAFFPRETPVTSNAPARGGMGAIGMDTLTDPRLQARRAGFAGIGLATPGMIPFGAYANEDPHLG